NHGTTYPFAIALLRTPSGHITLDALLHNTDDLSTLFSFTRAYFLVDMETPSAYVHFLKSLMPRKPEAELYTAIGLQKQGKTLFYRDFLHHLAHSHDHFDIAPGIKGMVMTVFTLPSYPYVFKMIRDTIAKDGMTHATVRNKYQLVKKHDRVGRMADTWEYSQVALPRARFSPALLTELRTAVPSLVEETGDTVVLRHVYIERRMTPLNIYLAQAGDTLLETAVKRYGDAIRELAGANIFPGDMLFKNFGVTRLGRVVFYDYDEIQRMTEMHFRRIPPAPNEEAELSGEVWYPVGPNDVFPEEFPVFLLGDPRVRAAFMKYHADLLTAEWWQASRERSAQGRIEDIFPYDDDRRLQHARRHSVPDSHTIASSGVNHV
ncbi:MAG: bifunctional isocitrate dehydrogenase kinase/phosphatase, partial [Burkholderiaceae bacterium]